MTKLSPTERESLLQALQEMGAGQAEGESANTFALRFLPVAEHLRAFQPDVILIVGERGSGKSELFAAAMVHNLLPSAARYTPEVGLQSLAAGTAKWLPAYPAGTNFPDRRGLHGLLHSSSPVETRATYLWFAYLVRILSGELDAQAKEPLAPLLSPQGGDVATVMQAFEKAGDAALLALDRLDERLARENRWLFVGYDELDTLADFDWSSQGLALSGLVGFWTSYSRRWRRLRAKIFMRTDLFRRSTGGLSADLPKLAANRVEITWSDRNLYAMLIKRLANSASALHQYCEEARIRFKPKDPELGWVPEIATAEDAKPLVQSMIGPYMGANQNKGLTFNWLLDHVRDGLGKAYPRALVRLVEQAAGNETDSPRATHGRIIDPTSIRRAIDHVSDQQVTQAIHGEWPWLAGVRDRVRDQSVPITRRKLESLLDQDWSSSWSAHPDIRPPAKDARSFVNYLVELGILRQRGDGRLDTPDLYQAGLALKRKGGVRRNK